MVDAISLHISLEELNFAHYGTNGVLDGCHNDARAMEDIAKSLGYATTALRDKQATSEGILDFLTDASRELTAGGTLLVTFAGHGSQAADLNHERSEGGLDETWCVWDRMIVDDELAEIWSMFDEGVRIIVVSDSCHSATVAKALDFFAQLRAANVDFSAAGRVPGPLPGDRVEEITLGRVRALPLDVYLENRELYDEIQQQTRGGEHVTIAASLITLSACRDDEYAFDGENGLYTSKLLSVWNGGAFRGGYREFQREIAGLVSGVAVRQNPQYEFIGRANPAFEAEKPFTSLSAVPEAPVERDPARPASTKDFATTPSKTPTDSSSPDPSASKQVDAS